MLHSSCWLIDCCGQRARETTNPVEKEELGSSRCSEGNAPDERDFAGMPGIIWLAADTCDPGGFESRSLIK